MDPKIREEIRRNEYLEFRRVMGEQTQIEGVIQIVYDTLVRLSLGAKPGSGDLVVTLGELAELIERIADDIGLRTAKEQGL